MHPEIEVEISNTQRHLRVEPASLERIVRLVLAAEGCSCASISIALVDNATIHTINQAHLGHDWPTDVITFPLADQGESELAGELVVSAEMACTVAGEFGVRPEEELALYVVHGLLHLCGFDDHDDSDRRRMRQREDELLARAGFNRPAARDAVAVHGAPARDGESCPDERRHAVLSAAHARAAVAAGACDESLPEGRPWTA